MAAKASSPKKSKKSAAPKSLKKPVASSVSRDASQPRRLPRPHYKPWHLQKRIKHQAGLPSGWQLTKQATKLLWSQKRLFVGITAIYGLLNLVLVRGLASGTNVSSLKTQFSQAFHGSVGQLATSASVFAQLVSTAGNGSSDTAGAYQLFLGLIVSVAIIWALRQTQAGVVIRVRDSFYRGMYPLVPFVLVLLVIGLQLLPLLIGSGTYSIVVSNGIATASAERLVWGLLTVALALLSLYMISSSVFALYIVTLPDMTPLKALRSAREIVRYRRWTVLRKFLAMPIILLLIAAVIMLPIIWLLTPIAQWIFFILTMFALVAIHSYLYSLYRALLNE